MNGSPKQSGVPGNPPRLPFCFRTVFPSLSKQTFVCFILLILYVIAIFAMFENLSDKSNSPAFMGASIFTLLVGYWACSCAAKSFLNFGLELRQHQVFPLATLWPLAFRVMLFPFICIVLFAPIIVWLLSGWYDDMLRQSWMLPINLVLLHIMFLVGTAFIAISPARNTIMIWGAKLLFPYRLVTGSITSGLVWFSLIFFNAISHIWNVEGYVQKALETTATYADHLMNLPVTGPLLLFWLDPYYLLMRLHSVDSRAGAPFAFAVVCVIAIVAMTAQLRRWLSADLDARYAVAYDEWLTNRHTVRRALMDQNNISASSDKSGSATPNTESRTGIQVPAVPRHEIQLKDEARKVSERIGLPEPDEYGYDEAEYILPSGSPPDIQLAEMFTPDAVLDSKKTLLLALLILLPVQLFISWTAGVLFAAWVVMSLGMQWTWSYASWILPHRVLPIIRGTILRRIAPRIVGDVVMSIIVVIAYGASPLYALLMTINLLFFRLVVLGCTITYKYQDIWTFLWMIPCILASAGMVLAVFIGIIADGQSMVDEQGTDFQIFLQLLAGQIGMIILSWTALALLLKFKYNGLVHYVDPDISRRH